MFSFFFFFYFRRLSFPNHFINYFSIFLVSISIIKPYKTFKLYNITYWPIENLIYDAADLEIPLVALKPVLGPRISYTKNISTWMCTMLWINYICYNDIHTCAWGEVGLESFHHLSRIQIGTGGEKLRNGKIVGKVH